MNQVLGVDSKYPDTYSPDVLVALPRLGSREEINFNPNEFSGKDIWTLFELSHLDLENKPQTYLGILSYPHISENIIESKSLKLYLNGFNNFKISKDDFKKKISTDLSSRLNTDAKLRLFNLEEIQTISVQAKAFTSIDNFVLNGNNELSARPIADTQLLYTNLFRSRCPVTAQPDWASIYFAIHGKIGIDEASLLSFIVSFRTHQAFHEQCVEEIILALRKACPNSEISVYARFTRRGGIDINPYRVFGKEIEEMKYLVQESEKLNFRELRQ